MTHASYETPSHDATGSDEEPLAHDPGEQHEPDPEATAAAVRQWTVAEVLAEAELPELTARVCVKASIDDRIATVRKELATLVDAEGRPLDEDDETAVGEQSNAERVRELADQDKALLAERAGYIWAVTFRGKSSDDMAIFNKRYYPAADKNGRRDLTDYNNRLIADCAIAPTMTINEVIALRGKLGSRAMNELAQTAQVVCIDGGVDVPKSLP